MLFQRIFSDLVVWVAASSLVATSAFYLIEVYLWYQVLLGLFLRSCFPIWRGGLRDCVFEWQVPYVAYLCKKAGFKNTIVFQES